MNRIYFILFILILIIPNAHSDFVSEDYIEETDIVCCYDKDSNSVDTTLSRYCNGESRNVLGFSSVDHELEGTILNVDNECEALVFEYGANCELSNGEFDNSRFYLKEPGNAYTPKRAVCSSYSQCYGEDCAWYSEYEENTDPTVEIENTTTGDLVESTIEFKLNKKSIGVDNNVLYASFSGRVQELDDFNSFQFAYIINGPGKVIANTGIMKNLEVDSDGFFSFSTSLDQRLLKNRNSLDLIAYRKNNQGNFVGFNRYYFGINETSSENYGSKENSSNNNNDPSRYVIKGERDSITTTMIVPNTITSKDIDMNTLKLALRNDFVPKPPSCYGQEKKLGWRDNEWICETLEVNKSTLQNDLNESSKQDILNKTPGIVIEENKNNTSNTSNQSRLILSSATLHIIELLLEGETSDLRYDVNQDGMLDILDARLLARYQANILNKNLERKHLFSLRNAIATWELEENSKYNITSQTILTASIYDVLQSNPEYRNISYGYDYNDSVSSYHNYPQLEIYDIDRNRRVDERDILIILQSELGEEVNGLYEKNIKESMRLWLNEWELEATNKALNLSYQQYTEIDQDLREIFDVDSNQEINFYDVFEIMRFEMELELLNESNYGTIKESLMKWNRIKEQYGPQVSLYVLRKAVGLEENNSNVKIQLFDINEDGLITSSDSLDILRMEVGLSPSREVYRNDIGIAIAYWYTLFTNESETPISYYVFSKLFDNKEPLVSSQIDERFNVVKDNSVIDVQDALEIYRYEKGFELSDPSNKEHLDMLKLYWKQKSQLNIRNDRETLIDIFGLVSRMSIGLSDYDIDLAFDINEDGKVTQKDAQEIAKYTSIDNYSTNYETNIINAYNVYTEEYN